MEETKPAKDKMEYRYLGNTGLRVSVLSLGNWLNNEDDAQTLECTKTALQNGINYFDTAEIYGLGAAETTSRHVPAFRRIPPFLFRRGRNRGRGNPDCKTLDDYPRRKLHSRLPELGRQQAHAPVRLGMAVAKLARRTLQQKVAEQIPPSTIMSAFSVYYGFSMNTDAFDMNLILAKQNSCTYYFYL